MRKAIRRFLSTPVNTTEFIHVNTSLADLPSLRRSLIYRSSNLGMLELDIVIGRWAKQNIPNLSTDQCRQYAEEVLSNETPDLYRMILGADETPDSNPDHFINTIKRAIGK